MRLRTKITLISMLTCVLSLCILYGVLGAYVQEYSDRQAREFCHYNALNLAAVLDQAFDSAHDISLSVIINRPIRDYVEALDRRDPAGVLFSMKEISAFAEKFVTGLSGGEWQRVLIARALCQEAGTLLLDEPVSNLDLQYQLSTLRQMRALAREKNACVVCVLHTLNLAAHYCDDILLLWRGEVYKSGAPADVITPATLREVYGVEAVACPLPGGQTEVVPVY